MANDKAMTREVPREEWVEFLDRFGQQHEGWLISLEVLDQEMGAQLAAENLPLRGISADLHGQDRVLINVGDTGAEHINHSIENVTRIQLKVDGLGAHEALELENADGTMTLLRFRVPAMPETVDGVVFARA